MADTYRKWGLQDTDSVSGRQIFKMDVPIESDSRAGSYGTYDFKVQADFEVRDKAGRVLLKTSGSASGEYWCGVFLWFVDGSDGTKVRLEETDQEKDTILLVPDVSDERLGEQK